MAKARRIPAYVHHKASGQARVRIDGKDHYLGVYGSPESKIKYDDLIGKLVIGAEPAKATKLTTVLAAWWCECMRRYGKRGKGRYGNAVCWRPVIRLLRENHGKEPAENLGPATLRRTIEREAEHKNWSLRYARDMLAKVKAIYKWAKNEELIRSSAYEQIRDVQIREGREKPPIEPVSNAAVDATLPHLTPLVADMVRFQRLTGCRPGELVAMKHQDIERTGDVWMCTMKHHKTAHRGKTRTIYIGPKAQVILAPWLLRNASHQHVWAYRYGTPYSTDSYRRAIHRTIDRVNEERLEEKSNADLLERWSPHQIRKMAATEIRKKLDVESAASVLGHSSSVVTQDHYAAADRERAIEAARLLG